MDSLPATLEQVSTRLAVDPPLARMVARPCPIPHPPHRWSPLELGIFGAVMARQSIKHAPNLKALREAFTGPAKDAKIAGDIELLQWLTEAKDKRKKELENA